MFGLALQASVSGSTIRPSLMPYVLGVFLMVLGSLMGKLRPTWFVGIRTPWTLSSKRSWDRTHRVGGWLFLALGAILIVGTATFGPLGTRYALGVVVGAVLALAVYSWFVWKDDPERTSPADTSPAEP